MEKSSKRIPLFCMLFLILGFIIGMLTDLLRHPRGEPVMIERVDTVKIVKTVEVCDTLIREVPVKLPIVRMEKELVGSPLNPMVEERVCSVEVAVPITQKQYADTNYRAWVSGYMPSLDSIHIYQRHRHPPDNKQSRLNLTVGAGMTYDGKLRPGVFIGVGYSFCAIKL